MPLASREFGPSPLINTNYLEIRENSHIQEGSLLDVKSQAEGQFSCSAIPSFSHFNLGKNSRKLSIWDIVVPEIEIRAAGNVVH